MQPIAPTYASDLLAPLHVELIRLLRGLADDDWERPTVAGSWRVRDVAAHLLDGQLRALSVFRDDHLAPPDQPIGGYDDLVRFLDRLNAEWTTASQRLSPRVLTDLLSLVGPEAAATYAALPPHEPSLFSVAWAGGDESENWMHVGREYTEWWHHQMQIRDAVGAPGLFERRWLLPLLDLSVRVLPRTYAAVEAEPGTCLVVEVEGLGGGAWCLVRGDSTWDVLEGGSADPDATIILDPDTAWKSLYHALDPAEARSRARLGGNEELAAPFFGARSVMVPSASAV
ncbi:maleylpyruvate isomerase N-terminal domain-containing protein [Rubrivirga marina]|uniref:Mycothiol-dependent maleylpyruvate isomerase metal-binding domain-containing protein n=1 Tax=Rubrivirga marina TaxID=1196024 RepID=A0A271J2M3_9BACT|nr:maleylpyruvate isomerase N-terminal domain-containing protein [Rubrivirga marina]PAP77215.1 hypothetical protein BSZ37_12620 [Rubrivirga marina]